jgi:hypothetical protein
MCVSERYIEREKEIVYLCKSEREREYDVCFERERDKGEQYISESISRVHALLIECFL